MTSYVRYRVADGVAEILLDRPPANALDISTLDQLIASIRRASDDDNVGVVLLRSAIASRFCAGLDLKTLLDTSASGLHDILRRLYVDLFDAQYNLGKPSIAIVDGAVRGGGMTVAVSCDIVIASSTASFGYPEIDNGLLPAIHYVHLPRIVGRQRAFDLLFTGRTFSANEACDLGIVSRVVDEHNVLEETWALAKALNAKPRETVRRGRIAFMAALDQNYRREIAAAVDAFCNAANTESAREGLRAFAEKRTPRWPTKIGG
ncbi:enoyl-CoA hydratase/isomerase family protein [Caballeronia sp. M23-90]